MTRILLRETNKRFNTNLRNVVYDSTALHAIMSWLLDKPDLMQSTRLIEKLAKDIVHRFGKKLVHDERIMIKVDHLDSDVSLFAPEIPESQTYGFID